jgi:hypothetical protein
MKQIFAIFLKDFRHLWAEIVASLAMLSALVIIYPHEWRTPSYGMAVGSSFLGRPESSLGIVASLLIVLVPISWLVLTARMVHTERLVGSTQFWLTRPYEWPKFLAAKLLFLICFLYAPFLAAQCILLAEAGFQPLAYAEGLFLNLIYITCILVLPFFALSSVTASFGKLTLVVLGVLLFIAGVAIAYSALPYELKFEGAGKIADFLSAAFFTCGCGAVVLVQYARRRTRVAWLLIGAMAVLLAALAFIAPDRWFMDRYFPVHAAGGNGPLALSLAHNPMSQPNATEADDKAYVNVVIPMQFAGIPAYGIVAPAVFRVSFEGPGGAHWQSPWHAVYGSRLLPDSPDWAPGFLMRRSVYERFESTPVTLTVAVAVDEARAIATHQVRIVNGDFSVPDVGICRSPEANFFSSPSFINCRSAVRQPTLTYVTAHWVDGACPAQASDDGTILGSGWVGGLDNDPAEFGITSVWQFDISLTNQWGRYEDSVHFRHLCPGSMLTFTSYQQTSTEQLSLTITDARLPALSSPSLNGTIAIPVR